MIEVEDLRRSFASRGKSRTAPALDGVSFSVGHGETHGILGPNGAGKTTLVKILSTLLLPTSGSARVAGHDVVAETAAVRHRVGMVFGGDQGLYDRITARQNLVFWSALYGVVPAVIRKRVPALLERVGLAGRADEPVERFSRGMRQRLHLARGLVGDPDVLFLDEPTVGMDPVATAEFRALVGELRAERRTILLTTHDMREAEALCDRVTLIDRGKLLVTGPPAEIGGLLGSHDHIDITLRPDQLPLADRLRALPEVAALEALEGSHALRVRTHAADGIGPVLTWLVGQGVLDVRTGRPRLEEAYVRLVGRRGLAL